MCHNARINSKADFVNYFLNLMQPNLSGQASRFLKFRPKWPVTLSFFLSFLQEYLFTFCFSFRRERREAGLTVVVDSRRQPPTLLLLSSMSEFQVMWGWGVRKVKYIISLGRQIPGAPSAVMPRLSCFIATGNSSHLSYCLTSDSLHTDLAFSKVRPFKF